MQKPAAKKLLTKLHKLRKKSCRFASPGRFPGAPGGIRSPDLAPDFPL